MIINQESLMIKKYSLVKCILTNSCNKNFFNQLDTLILKKYFDNAYEYSLTENIERINAHDLSFNAINKIVDDFIRCVENLSIFHNRCLFEMVKLSFLPAKKLNKTISVDTYFKLATYLHYVSHETNKLSFDFLILRITDNFLLKIKNIDNTDLSSAYTNLKYAILNKMIIYSYIPEKRENEATFLCWIDRLLYAVVEKEIDLSSFIILSKKILEITSKSIYIYWKLINSINYLLSQKDYFSFSCLRKYKSDLQKYIDEKYLYHNLSTDELQNILVSLLAKQNIVKEDYYYFFEVLASFAKKSEHNKLFSLQLCEYLLYFNQKKQIFGYRFIRKHFIDVLLSLFHKSDFINVKNKELQILIELWFNDAFFCFERKRLLFSIINILKSINTDNVKLNHNNFYKYCDILDYILATSPDNDFTDIIDFLAFSNENKCKIAKYFKLTNLHKNI